MQYKLNVTMRLNPDYSMPAKTISSPAEATRYLRQHSIDQGNVEFTTDQEFEFSFSTLVGSCPILFKAIVEPGMDCVHLISYLDLESTRTCSELESLAAELNRNSYITMALVLKDPDLVFSFVSWLVMTEEGCLESQLEFLIKNHMYELKNAPIISRMLLGEIDQQAVIELLDSEYSDSDTGKPSALA
ncbi:MAG: hypothetical protein K9L89_07765 [Kiritimatiellales bacterium]|nr:hypothetical protein [Kiritimatiellales bacterium]